MPATSSPHQAFVCSQRPDALYLRLVPEQLSLSSVQPTESQSPLTVAIPGDTTSSSTVVTPGGAAAEQQGPGQRVSYSGQGAAVAAAAGALAAASLNSPAVSRSRDAGGGGSQGFRAG